MDVIRIRGGRPLEGSIRVGGAKNAALPLMAAALLTDETVVLTNLPFLADITTLGPQTKFSPMCSPCSPELMKHPVANPPRAPT